jgi:hypothetical protein
MRTVTLAGVLGLFLLTGMLSGCAQDREQVLIGKWQTTAFAAPVLGAKLKNDAPAASGAQVAGAALVLGTAGMEVRKDKTFDLIWLGNTMNGTWSFDKKSGEMILNVGKIQPLPGLPGGQGLQPGAWVAYLDPDNLRLRLYPVPRESAELMKNSKGPMADGIPLKKQE